MDWLEEEKKKLGQIMDPVTKYTKMWPKHKMWELGNEGVQCTYDLMGDFDPHSIYEESTEQDPKGKGKMGSFKIKIKGVQVEEAKET